MGTKEILSYRAINVFVERDYLEHVVGSILEGLKGLSKEEQIVFNSQFKKFVTVLGFRNPVRAPLSLQINAFASAFEAKEELVPITLTTWAKLNSSFSEKVKSWLKAEGWDNLKTKRNYVHNEGFILDWPEDLTFDQINENFKKANPGLEYNQNDLILMVLWISGRLPKSQPAL